MNTKNLREQRGRAIEQAKTILETAETENREMTPDEARSWDGYMGEADTLKARIERAERMADEERGLEQSAGRRTSFAAGNANGDAELRSWLLGQTSNRDMAVQFANRALSTTVATAGGHTVAPEFQNELERALLSYGGARQAARVIRTTTGAELPWPTLNDATSEGRILGENVAANQSDLVFGSVSFGAYKYTSDLIVVSEELLQDTGIDIGTEIGTALGDRIGRVTNRHFTIGTGTAEPQGIVTGATLGVTGATATGVTYDELVDLEHSVNSAYRKKAKFVISDATLRQLKKLKDANGNPMWVPGLTSNAPDTLLGYPYVINDDVADMALSAKSILFGDVSKFIIRDVKEIVLRRLDERFAEQHAVGFVAFSRHDSRMVDAGTHPVKFFQNAAV
jgi:HK97 family phage major capsid protein